MDRHSAADVQHRPREKLLHHGPAVLSDAELVAIVLRTGTRAAPVMALAQQVLAESHGLAGLGAIPFDQLRAVAGLGPVKAVTLMAAIELARRWNQAQLDLPAALLSSQAVFDRYRCQFQSHAQEHLLVLCLDAKNRPLREVWLSSGSRRDVVFTPRQIFSAALASNAVGIIVVHNHPSGDPHPSTDDLDATHQLQVTGRLLNVPLLDHLIVGDDTYFSLRDERLLDPR